MDSTPAGSKKTLCWLPCASFSPSANAPSFRINLVSWKEPIMAQLFSCDWVLLLGGVCTLQGRP